MQWTGAHPADDALTFYLLNRAVDYDDFAAAMRTMTAPAQNFAYADDAGMIAMWVAGLFPIRKAGLGRIPHDGASGEFDWKGFIPAIETPHAANPTQRYLASANQRPAPDGYAHYLGYEWDPGYRARRINRLLASSESITTEQMASFQTDTYDTAAESMLPHLIAACKDAFEEGKLYARALETLSGWDYYTTADSPAPTIWWRWLDKLAAAVWADEWLAAGIDPPGESWGFTDLNKWRPPLEVLEKLVVEEPASKWFDDVSTEDRETLAQIATGSLREAVDELRRRQGKDLSEWNWGIANRLRIDHLSGDPLLGRGGHPLGGSDLTLSAGGSGGEVTGGPSWRMIVDFSDPGSAVGIFPGGQSGDPRSLHYDDLIDDWARGEYVSLLFYPSHEEFPAEQIEERLKLLPPLPHVESTIP
jgi:penicillin amidase